MKAKVDVKIATNNEQRIGFGRRNTSCIDQFYDT